MRSLNSCFLKPQSFMFCFIIAKMTNSKNNDYILQNFQDDTRFPALNYAKQSGCEGYTECKKSLLASLNIISNMSVKSNPGHKPCILWTREVKKDVDQVTALLIIDNNSGRC